MMQKNRHHLQIKTAVLLVTLFSAVMFIINEYFSVNGDPTLRSIVFILMVFVSIKFVFRYKLKQSLIEGTIFIVSFTIVEALSAVTTMVIFNVTVPEIQGSLYYNLILNTFILCYGLIPLYFYNRIVLKEIYKPLNIKLMVLDLLVLLISLFIYDRTATFLHNNDFGQSIVYYFATIAIITLLVTLIVIITLIYNKNERYKIKLLQMEEKYKVDPLTKALQREYGLNQLEDRRSHNEKNNCSFVIAYIDVNDFKKINDLYGHAKGDEVLIEVTDHIKALLRHEDLIIRLGGDEFLIGIMNIKMNEAEIILSRVNENLESVLEVEKISISYGLVQVEPNEQSNLDILIDRADRSMYEMKKQRKLS